MSGHWIMFGDTRVRIRSDAQLDATCRLFNLTVTDEEVEDMYTYEQFQATRREVPDIGADPAIREDDMLGLPGYIYQNDWWIERLESGQFYLFLENQQWTDADLGALEARMYLHLKDAGELG